MQKCRATLLLVKPEIVAHPVLLNVGFSKLKKKTNSSYFGREQNFKSKVIMTPPSFPFFHRIVQIQVYPSGAISPYPLSPTVLPL